MSTERFDWSVIGMLSGALVVDACGWAVLYGLGFCGYWIVRGLGWL